MTHLRIAEVILELTNPAILRTAPLAARAWAAIVLTRSLNNQKKFISPLLVASAITPAAGACALPRKFIDCINSAIFCGSALITLFKSHNPIFEKAPVMKLYSVVPSLSCSICSICSSISSSTSSPRAPSPGTSITVSVCAKAIGALAPCSGAKATANTIRLTSAIVCILLSSWAI